MIYRGCQNRFLAEQAGALRRRLQAYRRMQLRFPKRIRDSFDEHQAIVDAIISGDESLAEERLRNHVLIQGERFTDFVAMIGNESSQASRSVDGCRNESESMMIYGTAMLSLCLIGGLIRRQANRR